MYYTTYSDDQLCIKDCLFSAASGSYIYLMKISKKRCLLQSNCHNFDLFWKHGVGTKLLKPFAFHLDALSKRYEKAMFSSNFHLENTETYFNWYYSLSLNSWIHKERTQDVENLYMDTVSYQLFIWCQLLNFLCAFPNWVYSLESSN